MSLKRNLVLAASASAMLLQSGHALADKCFDRSKSGGFQSALGDRNAKAIPRTQASNTWEDWIWRGPEWFRCPKSGVNFCTDTYGKSHTQGYSWTVGMELGLGGIPVIGGFAGVFTPSGNYSRNESFTSKWDRSVQLKPGYASKPYQAIVRRWVRGNFQGMHVNTGRNCVIGKERTEGRMYSWNSGRTYGSWQGNRQDSRFFSYQTYKY